MLPKPPSKHNSISSLSQALHPTAFLKFYFYLLIYFWLCWVFVPVREPSPVAASGGHSSSRCAGLSLLRPLLLRSMGSRRAGSAIVAHGPSCSAACGILPDQGSNPCPLHWQADSQPLRHQGSPHPTAFILRFIQSFCKFLLTIFWVPGSLLEQKMHRPWGKQAGFQSCLSHLWDSGQVNSPL